MAARSLVLIVPAVWLGLLMGISLIEAPLKFTAPGITIPLGLGIGRRVFLAMNIVEVVLVITLLIALVKSLGAPPWGRGLRVGTGRIWLLGLVATAVLALKTLVIRPVLNQRTDAVLAGESAGGSTTHYLYIAADGLLILTLIALLIIAALHLLRPAPAVESSASR